MTEKRKKRKSRGANRRKAGDLGPPERRKHGPLVVEKVPPDVENRDGGERARAIAIDDPLYVYRRNRVITAAQRDAGLILREFWNRSGREPRLVAPYAELVSRGNTEGVHVTSAEHHRRFVEAIRAVGPIGSDVVVSVVCMQEFIPRGHYEILRRSLALLAKRFGLASGR